MQLRCKRIFDHLLPHGRVGVTGIKDPLERGLHHEAISGCIIEGCGSEQRDPGLIKRVPGPNL